MMWKYQKANFSLQSSLPEGIKVHKSTAIELLSHNLGRIRSHNCLSDLLVQSSTLMDHDGSSSTGACAWSIVHVEVDSNSHGKRVGFFGRAS